MKNQKKDFFLEKSMMLPILPVDEVAYPGQILTLFLENASFLQLIRVCEENNSLLGILPVINNQLFAYGCMVRIVSVDRGAGDGLVKIVFRGEKIFHLLKFFEEFSYEDKPYPMGLIDYPAKKEEFYEQFSLRDYEKAQNVFFEITNIFREKGGCDLLKDDEIFYFLMTKKTKGRLSSYCMAANLLGLHLGEKATLLTIKSEKKRLKMMYFQMKNLLSVLKKVFKD